MDCPVSWLKEYVKTDASPAALHEVFAGLGFPVEGEEERAGDTVLDVEVTSNRGDCQSLMGLAREVAAQSEAKLTPPVARFEEDETQPVEQVAQLGVRAPERCPRYIARCIRGVTVGPSPQWLQQRLESMGLQPRNNIVDVTNYVMYELGQPLHAFDHDKLVGGRIVVRMAEPQEEFTPLYGDKPQLGLDDLVIADADKPVALAGVIGGAGAEVGNATTNILLEAAVFDPVGVRQTSRRTAIATDSSFRFERNVDPVGVEFASQRATALIVELAGGTVCAGKLDSNEDPVHLPKVRLRRTRIAHVLGYEVPQERIPQMFDALGFEIVSEDTAGWLVRVPSWRLHDVYREIDLIEEVARVYGYDHCPVHFAMKARVPEPNAQEEIKREIRSVLCGGGYYEVVTDSLRPRHEEKSFNPWSVRETLDLGATAMRSDHAALRVSLLPSLMEVKLRNQNEAGRRTVRLFETGLVYLPQGEQELPVEKLVLGILDDGDYSAEGRQLVPGYRRLKGALEAVSERLRLPPLTLRPFAGDDSGRFLGLSEDSRMDIVLDGQSVGVMGEPSDPGLRQDLQVVPAVAELDLTVLLSLERKRPVFQPLPRYPSVARDVALVLDESVTWQDLVDAVEKHRPELLVRYELIDIYRGKQVGRGKKSVAFRLVYRSPERTLTDDDVSAVHEPLVQALLQQFKATQRGA